MITLGALLARRELGLAYAWSAAGADKTPIATAEVCDLADPRPWLDQGTMMLTTGVGVGHSAHTQRLCVERAAQAGVAAIGFAIGLAHALIPPSFLDAAREQAIPLVTVPPGTPFSVIVAAVSEHAVPHQLGAVERSLAIQSYLMEALAAQAPSDELFRRLGSLLGGTALVVDDSGAIEGGPRSAVPPELWGPMRGAHSVVIQHIRGRRYLSTPVATGPTGRWLVVVGDPQTLPDQLARQAIKSGERLVRLIDRTRPPRPSEARVVRREIADRLFGLRQLGDRQVLTLRMTALGFDVDREVFALVCRAAETDPTPEVTGQQIARIQSALETALGERTLPFALTEDDDAVLAVLGDQAVDRLDLTLQQIADETTCLDVGGGRLVTLDRLTASLRDARLALARVALQPRRADQRLRLLTYSNFDLATTLAADADAAIAAGRSAALLGRIRGDDLRATLLAYFEHDLDVPSTAAYLHLHANSLRYRLGRIEEALGLSLRSPLTIANIQLALLIEQQARKD